MESMTKDGMVHDVFEADVQRFKEAGWKKATTKKAVKQEEAETGAEKEEEKADA